MKNIVAKTLGKHLDPALRQCVSTFAFSTKSRKIRLALLQCLITYPEYTNRLTEIKKLASRDAKFKAYTPAQTEYFIEYRYNLELENIYSDMKSAYTRLLALVKFDKKIEQQPDLTELYKHVHSKPSFFYISD